MKSSKAMFFQVLFEAAIAFAISCVLFLIWTIGTGDVNRILG